MSTKIEHKIIDGIECKRCSTCKRWLPLNKFVKYKATLDGLNYQCKECTKQYRENNKERIKNRQKQYRKNNKEKIRAQNKRRYKQKQKLIKQKFGNKCFLCEKTLFKKKSDFRLHHVSYESYKKYPGSPMEWSVSTLKQLDKNDFLLLCPSCHDLIHGFLNIERWKRPCGIECVIKKLLKLKKDGKLNWHHGEKK